MPDNGGMSGSIMTKEQEVSIPMGFHDGSGKVSIEETEQEKIIPANIKQGITLLGVEGEYSGESFLSQSKTVVPSKTQQIVQPDIGYDFLSSVTDNANPHHMTKGQLALGNVDNTSDMDKPVSTAQQEAIDTTLSDHNDSEFSHGDMRLLISGIDERPENAEADTIAEIVNTLFPENIFGHKSYSPDSEVTDLFSIKISNFTATIGIYNGSTFITRMNVPSLYEGGDTEKLIVPDNVYSFIAHNKWLTLSKAERQAVCSTILSRRGKNLSSNNNTLITDTITINMFNSNKCSVYVQIGLPIFLTDLINTTTVGTIEQTISSGNKVYLYYKLIDGSNIDSFTTREVSIPIGSIPYVYNERNS
jgi:hypothetical protein